MVIVHRFRTDRETPFDGPFKGFTEMFQIWREAGRSKLRRSDFLLSRRAIICVRFNDPGGFQALKKPDGQHRRPPETASYASEGLRVCRRCAGRYMLLQLISSK